jgi:steroid 5-alpha reductase family enzyme
MPRSGSRALGFAWIAVAYAVAAAVAVAVWTLFGPGAPAWEKIAAADGAATVAVFAFSVVFDNSSFYDPYWSVAPMLIAPALAAQSVASVPSVRRALVVALVLAWGARLTYNWARGWQGLAHEDWRYVDHRGKGRPYWVVSFVGFHMMPTIWVYLGCLSLVPAIVSGTRPVGVLDGVAFAVTAAAIALEAIADQQLRAFRLALATPGRILDTGVWAMCRHPNYLGELTFWWGLYLFALAADPSWWWAVVGPLSITLLFALLSVPLIDRRSLARRPGYRDHMQRVPALFPRPWSRRAE